MKGFLNLFISKVERNNPEALLELEKEHLREQISKYNQGLAAHAALCERLMNQIKKLEAEEKDLRAKITANLRVGNRGPAGQYALRLQTVTRELEEDRKQLEQAEETYKNLVQARDVAVSAAKAKIDALKRDIDDLKIKKAMAELNEMASGMVSGIGGSGDTINRLQEMVEEERMKAAGRARVAKDTMDLSDVKLQETEQAALAEQALADFAASEGISLEPASGEVDTPSQNPTRTMGPAPEPPQSTEQA